jgi:hypothetical protein
MPYSILDRRVFWFLSQVYLLLFPIFILFFKNARGRGRCQLCPLLLPSPMQRKVSEHPVARYPVPSLSVSAVMSAGKYPLGAEVAT